MPRSQSLFICARLWFSLPDFRGQAQPVAGEDECVVFGGEFQGAHFREFDTGVEPRTIGAEKDLVSAGAGDGFFDQLESHHRRRVREDVGVTGKWVEKAALGAPVVAKAAQVWNDEIDV